MDVEMPSQIFPMRLVRAFSSLGHKVIIVQGEHEWLPKEKRFKYKEWWGEGLTVEGDVPGVVDKLLDYLPTPDLFIVANTVNDKYYSVAEKHDVLIAPFISDPFYQGLPSKEYIERTYGNAPVVFCNEGHAANYINEFTGNAVLINHAYDTFLGPSDDEVAGAEKTYLASICAGFEIKRFAPLLRMFYIPSLRFKEHCFAIAGALDVRYPIWITADHRAELTHGEIMRYTDVEFNVTRISEPLVNPVSGSKAGVQHWDPVEKKYKPWFGGGLSHPRVHRLYMQSYLGVSPYGRYLYDSIFARGTLGTKIFEQLGSGCAVLCNYIPGVEGIVEDGKTGFIMSNDLDPEEQVKYVMEIYQYVIDNPDEARKMGMEARKRILKKHTWQHRARQILKITRKL